MMNFLSLLLSIYLFPVAVIMALYLSSFQQDDAYDEEAVSEFLEEHLDENIFAYVTVQTIFYAWIYVMVFM